LRIIVNSICKESIQCMKNLQICSFPSSCYQSLQFIFLLVNYLAKRAISFDVYIFKKLNIFTYTYTHIIYVQKVNLKLPLLEEGWLKNRRNSGKKDYHFRGRTYHLILTTPMYSGPKYGEPCTDYGCWFGDL
jgi:hypothetical protein